MSDDVPAGAWRQRLAREHGVDLGTDASDVQDVDRRDVVDDLEGER